MRNRARILAAALLAPAVLAAYGCSDDDGEARPPADVGVDAGVDVAAPPDDAGLDARPSSTGHVDAAPPGPPGPLTIVVRDPGAGPVAGAVVVFDDLDGTRTVVATDGAGAVTHTVTPGASVTVGVRSGGSRELTTITGVVVPSEITIGDAPIGFVAIGYEVGVTAFGGAVSYLADWGCETTAAPAPGAPATGSISSLCLDDTGAARVLVTARDANGSALAFGRAVVSPVDGRVAAAIEAWTPAGPAARASITGAPLEVVSSSIEVRYVDGPLAYGGGSGAAPFTFVRPPATATADLLLATSLSQTAESRTGRIVRQPIGTGDLAPQPASEYLPAITMPVVTVTAGAPTLAFAAGRGIEDATAVVARINSTRLEGADAVPLGWTLVARPGYSIATRPLPPELAGFVATDPWSVQFVTALRSPSFRYATFQTQAMTLWRGARNRSPRLLGNGPITIDYATYEP